MHRARLLAILVSVLSQLQLVGITHAWELDGSRPVPSSFNQFLPSVESDTEGGLLIAWLGQNALGSYVVRMQRMDRDGRPMWGWEGISLDIGEDAESGIAKLLGTADGGAFVVWEAHVGSSVRLVAQRVNASGVPQWGSTGTTVREAAGGIAEYEIVPDGSGGFVVAWVDTRSGNEEIYGQRITAAGASLWLANGRPICTTSGDKHSLAAAPTGTGGVYVAWSEDRGFGSQFDVYVQRVSPTGAPSWTFNGIRVADSPVYDVLSGIETADDGGLYVHWATWDVVSYSGTPYLQKLTSTGSKEWAPEGVALVTNPRESSRGSMTSGLDGSVILTWTDTPLGSTQSNLYAQRILADGSRDWGPYGVVISRAAGSEYSPQIVGDGRGGAVAFWKNGSGSSAALYAQRIDAQGRTYWTADGAPVCEASGEPTYHVGVRSADEALFIAWQLGAAVYAQRLEMNSGSWGRPEPDLIGAFDIPLDQGGYVELTWAPGDRDAPGRRETERYSIWRATTAILPKGAIVLESAKDLQPDALGPVFVTDDGFYWEWLGDQPAVRRAGYSYAAATRNDSTAAGSNVHRFQVIAHGDSPDLLWLSRVVSGYSVDNLAPPAPSSLVVGYGAVNTLSWSPVEAEDLHSYRVHRSADPLFTPDATNVIASTTATNWTDDTHGFGVHYAVLAVDRAGNASPAAFATTITDAPPLTGSGRLVLHPNAPNPFNPLTRVTFEIPAGSRVTLDVVDTAGRRVRTLIGALEMTAGVHSVVWDGRDERGRDVASGNYRCRLLTELGSASTAMVLVR